MSAICTEFVQNAWRKDLCSNCFKPKSEHDERNEIHGDSADENGMPPLVPSSAMPKHVPYSPYKRTILDASTKPNGCQNGVSNNNNKLTNNNNNNSNQAGSRYIKNNGTPSPRKIGTSGVHLWEVGQMPRKDQGDKDEEVKVTNGLDNGVNGKEAAAADSILEATASSDVVNNKAEKVQGILKEKQVKIEIKKMPSKRERRGSVGFIDGSPQVIGYGGHDYEWDDQESSEEPSDVDSLENFDLTEEDKVFSQLTDRNTEYNADNTNLLLNESSKQASIFTKVETGDESTKLTTSVADKLNPQSFYSMPPKAVANPETTADGVTAVVVQPSDLRDDSKLQPSSEAQSFIHSLFSAETDKVEPEEDFEEDDGTFIVKSDTGCVDIVPNGADQMQMQHRAGSVTVPTRKYPATYRATVQQLFNEEPVTAAEMQAVSLKLPPIGATFGKGIDVSCGRIINRGDWVESEESSSLMSSKSIVDSSKNKKNCSPYDVVSCSSISKGSVTPMAPGIPSSPPPASNDESQKYPFQPKGTKHLGCSASQASNGFAQPKGASNHDKAVVNNGDFGHSKNAVGICSTFHSPALKDSDVRFRNREYATVNYSCHYASSYITNGVEKNVPPTVTALPPTPLTNPYSSTAILKGIPKQPSVPLPSPEQSPQKPPVIKPKPKLPAKPIGLPQKSPEEDRRNGIESVVAIQNSGQEVFTEDSSGKEVKGSESSARDLGNGSVYYQEIDKDNIQNPANSSFESKVTSLTSAIDFSKRTPKRQAPRPPSDSQLAEQTPSRKLSNQNPVPVTSATDTSNGEAKSGFGYPMSESMPNEGSGAGGGRHMTRMSSYTLGSTGATSNPMSRTSTSSLNGYEYYFPKESPHKENSKLKKSRFSLRKFLKFGSKDDGEDSKGKGKGFHHFNGSSHERKTKLEILHPIDLLNNAANEAAAESQNRTGSLDTSSSSKTSSIGSHQGTIVLNEIYHVQDLVDDGATICEKQVLSRDSPDRNQAAGVPASSRYKPPPPPRSRSQTDENNTATKDKPSRPPPPNKRSQTLTRTPAMDVSQEEQPDASTPILRNKENANNNEENRCSLYSVGMEYANLGDVRNNLAPKKPGRCSSNSMIDVTLGLETSNLESSNVSNSREDLRGNDAEQFNGDATSNIEVTYYSPPSDQQPFDHPDVIDLDELYADQINADTSDQSPFSSINLDSLSSSSSNAKSERQPRSIEISESSAGGCKVYERMVLKQGNLEKVYAKAPVAAAATAESNVPASISNEPDEGDLSGVVAWPRRKSSRLSLRKAKTVVHKNLEDNYGAVVSANHQTLTQILEQVTLTQQTNASKFKLLGEVSPHWTDFKLLEDSQVTMVGDRAFYSSVWQQSIELTLMVSQEPLCATSHSTRNSCVLVPIVEFEDVIPTGLISKKDVQDGYCRSTIWVFERMRVETLSSVAESLHLQSSTDVEAYEREACFVLLQLINGLKHLQVLGIEEVDAGCTDFILIMKNNDANYRLVIVPEAEKFQKKIQEKLSLCQSALAGMFLLLNVASPVDTARSHDGASRIPASLPSGEAFRLIAEILHMERATSLSQAKLLLEYLLWGPTDLQGELRSNDPKVANPATLVDGTTEQEQAYQRWLDLERATVLNNLIRTQSLWQIRLTVFEEYMLSFLVRTCAKTLRDAANQLQTNRFRNS